MDFLFGHFCFVYVFVKFRNGNYFYGQRCIYENGRLSTFILQLTATIDLCDFRFLILPFFMVNVEKKIVNYDLRTKSIIITEFTLQDLFLILLKNLFLTNKIESFQKEWSNHSLSVCFIWFHRSLLSMAKIIVRIARSVHYGLSMTSTFLHFWEKEIYYDKVFELNCNPS